MDEWAQEADLVRQAEQFGRWNAASIARNLRFMGPESEIPILDEYDEEDALLCEIMDNAQLNDPPTVEDLVDVEINGQTRIKTTAEWYPYPTKMDYANPLTRSLLHFYPEIPDGPISEAWRAQKWQREIDRDAFTPMTVDGHRHFYVNELARRHDGSFVIPLCWVLFKGEMHADAVIVTVDGDVTAHVDTTEILIRAADLLDNYLDLQFKKLLPSAWDGKTFFSCKISIKDAQSSAQAGKWASDVHQFC
ncbi:hypothetical protein MVEN_01841800 [Mycena venus]|uniref:Uncharacterized protein n=1 Tax=Mycena venus TaxID=2733690 RepID=A0A8H6XLA4_9AGAR|nr:hypothetical protein MVEN_01841800 [Mycena venus]